MTNYTDEATTMKFKELKDSLIGIDRLMPVSEEHESNLLLSLIHIYHLQVVEFFNTPF